MAELIVKDAPNRPGYKRVGIYELTDGLVSVVHLGDFPAKVTQQGGSSAESIARLILGEFPSAT